MLRSLLPEKQQRWAALIGRPNRVQGKTEIGLSRHEVRVGECQIGYEAAGEGEPVVLVHGLSASTRWWSRNMRAIAERHRIYLVDLPGFGAMRSQRFVLAETVTWLSEWMEAVGLEQAHLVGHSMGGYASVRLAASRPDLVRRLVLVAPAGVPTERSMLGHLIPLLLTARHASPAFMPVLFRDALRMGSMTLWRTARDLLAEDVRGDLGNIEAPTLLVWGENDPLIPPAVGDLFRKEISNSRLLSLQKAGHVPMFDQSKEFDAALLSFLAGELVGE